MRDLYRHDPVVAVSGSGSRFVDLDGNSYLDFNAADLSMAAGFAPPAITAAIIEQAQRGNHFLLPTTDALAVCQALTDRFGLPQWQFTLSASGANTDALRIARVATGRSTVLLFDGKYHGHLDQTLWSRDGDQLVSDLDGLDPESGRHVDVLTYNDPDQLRQRLARGDVAAVLVEPALTNTGLVLPSPEFVSSLNHDVRAAGAVLIVDETHTQFAVYGGGSRRFGIHADILTGGKGIGGGVPIGVVGLSDELASVMDAHRAHDPGLMQNGDSRGIATGGTLYANALSLAAARAGLEEVFTEQASVRVDALGARLQTGLQELLDDHSLPWTADRLGGRIQWRLTAQTPVTGEDGAASVVLPLADARKVFMANRGVWDAIASAGPSVSYAADEADIDTYLLIAGEFLDAVTS
jgi:glutamate-1-semialdehyde 2,1-aminomutase